MSVQACRRLLLIEDNAGDARLLREMFNEPIAPSTQLQHVQSLGEAERYLAQHEVDVVLLDLGLPDQDGLSVAKRLREWSSVPILVISARGQEDVKVKALDSGADDYLTKPFGAAELMARLRVALRHAARSHEAPSAVVRIGDDVTIDLIKRQVTVRGAEVHLTPIEYKLLTELAKHAGLVVTHRHLLEQVWGPGHTQQMQYLRVYMTQLRHKLEQTPARPRYLVTEPGIGYRLKVER